MTAEYRGSGEENRGEDQTSLRLLEQSLWYLSGSLGFNNSEQFQRLRAELTLQEKAKGRDHIVREWSNRAWEIVEEEEQRLGKPNPALHLAFHIASGAVNLRVQDYKGARASLQSAIELGKSDTSITAREAKLAQELESMLSILDIIKGE